MKVAIDGRAIGSGRGGDETYTTALLAGLAEVAEEDDLFPLYLPAGRRPPAAVEGDRRFPVRRLGSSSELVRYSRELPRALKDEPVDVLHCLTFAPLRAPAPLALQVTDLSFRHHPRWFAPATSLRLNLLVPLLARRARAVLTLSEFCRRDLVASYRLPAECVFAIPIGLGARAAPDPELVSERLAALGVSQPYFLYLGNRHPRKNLARLVRAFGRARRASPELAGHRLVLAGATWWGAGEETVEARRLDPSAVVMLDRVPDPDRDALMAGAEALLYPSLFEGFGLPPLEAMALGTPVMAAAGTALVETCGDAALMVDPLDVEAMAAAIVTLGTDAALRERLRRAGRRRAGAYTSRAMGERAMEAFRWAAGRRREPARAGAGR